MARRELKGLRAIVTGASGGIGRAVALELARAGVRCILFARRAERLDEVCQQAEQLGSKASVLVGDVTDAEARKACLEFAERELSGLDLLVNNAGISASGEFAGESSEVQRKIFEVNFFAAAEFTREAIPLLRQGRTPMIVNVGSILGHRGIPYTSAYCASKFAITGWSQSLRAELSTEGIDVLLVSPGTTESELADNLVEQRIKLPWSGMRGVTAEYVAEATVKAISRGGHEIVPNWRGWWMLFAHRLSPALVDSVMAKLARKANR
ncbi:SDR family NAD(P)-dependent oxidoreductase [Aeoliella sp.]|uniref:SDR family NAD(P)-dependent oxidoreductase n=1 Tax=Aeoliella sp. TaxID=2795800 RepID=UPI003CCBFF6B